MRTSNYPRRWHWPNGQKLALSIGLAFEAFERHSQFSSSSAAARGKINHFSLSYADYGWKAGVWWLLDLLERYGLKANMSTSGLAAERHPEVVTAVAKAGHELNAHGWVNDRVPSDDDETAERNEIKRCTAAIADAAGVRPVGWTGPGSAGSKNTLSILTLQL
jgi:peptidoglycan/xylan/chitin deacetylase (PgdA/CDA1 family)